MALKERYAEARRSGRPLVGGHRGNPADHPENTLASFHSAIELGVDLIECDVHMSSDGHLVVIHDHTLDRTTDGRGMVRDHAWEELRSLDAGGGERIPSLAEVISVAREGRVGLAIEVKQLPLPYPQLEERLVEALRAERMVEHSVAISFDHRSCRRLKEIEPGLQVGLLDAARPIDVAGLLRGAGGDVWCPHYGAMDPDLVAEVHGAGAVVGVWTVNDEPAILWCQFCRPDSIFSDRPGEVLPRFRG